MIQVIPALALIVCFLMPDQKEIKWLALLLSIRAALESSNTVRVDKHAIEGDSSVRPCLLTAGRGAVFCLSQQFPYKTV